MFRADLGFSNEANYWTNFEGLCLKATCRRYLRAEEGLFCANFYSKRGSFAPCLSVWCPECYVGKDLIDFLIKRQIDEDGVDITALGDEKRFKTARAGDHLMTPFQCELCHFHNIYNTEPRPYDLEDIEITEYTFIVATRTRCGAEKLPWWKIIYGKY
jgi:hypothetical protein